jgi:FkbM family methyltransferase
MINGLNDLMRNHCAPLHSIAKAVLKPWIRAEFPRFPAIRTLHGQVLRTHPRFLTQDLDSIEPEVFAWMRRLLRSGATALDIGANVGFHSAYMARLVGSSGSVFAFEPSPANLKVLRYHIGINNLKQVRVLDKAVSDQDGGSIPFFLLNGGDHPSNSLAFHREEIPNLDKTLRRNARVLNVHSITVDRFCAENGVVPNLIKVDVEGAELQVLQGSAEILCSARPYVILAVHPWWLPPGQTTKDLISFLTDRAYVVRNMIGNEVRDLEYGEYVCEPSRGGVSVPGFKRALRN